MKGMGSRNFEIRTLGKERETGTVNLCLKTQYLFCTVPELLKEFWMIFSSVNFSFPFENFSPRYDQ